MNIKLPKYNEVSKVIDKFIITSKFILPLFVLLIFLIFEFTFTFGNFIAFYLDILLNYLYGLSGIDSKLADAIFGGIAGIFVYIPNIIILYFFLFLLNDSGLLPRISYVFYRYLRKIGLTGASFLSLFLGFGCTIPAILSTKNIESKKERILAIMMLPFVSCSAKIPVFVLFTSIFIPNKLQSVTLVFIYLVGIIFGIFSNYFLSKILKHKNRKFEINLPNYRLPNIKTIFKEIYNMLKEFVVKIGIYILPFSLILTLAFTYPVNEKIENTYGGKMGKYVQVIFEPLGFNEEMSISVISGLIGKEITVSTLGSLYYIQDGKTEGLINKINGDESVTFFSAISFLLFILIYSPCVGAIFTARKELGNIWGFLFFAYPLIFAWIVSFCIYNLLNYLF